MKKDRLIKNMEDEVWKKLKALAKELGKTIPSTIKQLVEDHRPVSK